MSYLCKRIDGYHIGLIAKMAANFESIREGVGYGDHFGQIDPGCGTSTSRDCWQS